MLVHLHDHQGDIVDETMRAGEEPDLLQNPLDQFLGRKLVRIPEQLRQALLAEQLVVRVAGFRHTIGIKQEDVAGYEADAFLLVGEFPAYAKDQPLGIQAPAFAGRLSPEQRRRMAGAGIGRRPLSGWNSRMNMVTNSSARLKSS